MTDDLLVENSVSAIEETTKASQNRLMTIFKCESGREVLCKQLLNNARTADTTLDVRSLQSGIYYVSVQTASGIATQRLVLE